MSGVFTCTKYLHMLSYSVNEGLIIYYYTKYYKACLHAYHDTFVTEDNLTCQNIGKLRTVLHHCHGVLQREDCQRLTRHQYWC